MHMTVIIRRLAFGTGAFLTLTACSPAAARDSCDAASEPICREWTVPGLHRFIADPGDQTGTGLGLAGSPSVTADALAVTAPVRNYNRVRYDRESSQPSDTGVRTETVTLHVGLPDGPGVRRWLLAGTGTVTGLVPGETRNVAFRLVSTLPPNWDRDAVRFTVMEEGAP